MQFGVWALTSGSFRIVSDTLVLRVMQENKVAVFFLNTV